MNSELKSVKLEEAEFSLPCVVAQTTEDLFGEVALPSELRKRIRTNQLVVELTDELLQANQLEHTLLVLAHALQWREGLLWCCFCIEELNGQVLSSLERWHLENCVRWILQVHESLHQCGEQGQPALNFSPTIPLCQAIQNHGAYLKSQPKKEAGTAKRHPPGFPGLIMECLHRVINRTGIEELPVRDLGGRQSCAIAFGIAMAHGMFHFAKTAA